MSFALTPFWGTHIIESITSPFRKRTALKVDKLKHWLQTRKETELGMLAAVACAIIWGILPMYWKSLHSIDPFLLMFYRLLLACFLVFIINLYVYRWKGIWGPLKQKGAIRSFALAGLMISINWSLYIFMVNADMIIQTSIGYYIEPLVVSIFGILFFHERMNRSQLIAFLFACLGVGIMLFSYGGLPVFSLVLSISFATYAAIKKKLQAPALLALFYETFFLAPVVLAVVLYLEFTGRGAFSQGTTSELILLSFSGLFTAVPLVLFAMAANRINLVTLGITEYLSPSMALILGIFLYHETFDRYLFSGFMLIWIGLVIFTVDGMRTTKEPKYEIDQAEKEYETNQADKQYETDQ